MRGAPLHLSWRFDRKAWLTVGGIALCVAFAVLSFTVVHGLDAATEATEARLGESGWVVSRPDLVAFDARAPALGNGTRVLVLDVTLADGREVTLAAVEGAAAVPVAEGTLRPGRALGVDAPAVNVTAPAATTLAVGDVHRVEEVPAHWGLVAPGTLPAWGDAFADGHATYAVVDALAPADRARLTADGFHVTRAPAIVPFFESGTREVARDLWLVVAFSSVLVAVLAFEFMHVEVREKRREIGIWRALGMRRGRALLLLLAHAGLMGVAGFAAGAAAALGLVTVAARATGLALLAPRVDAALVSGVAATTLAATVLGALVPARRAVSRPPGDVLEARP